MSRNGSISLFLLVCGVRWIVAANQTCESSNSTTCEQCLLNTTCLWCTRTKLCMTYPAATILPPQSMCPLNDARWGQCSINFQNLIITLALLALAGIIAFFICIFWYCKCENCGNSIQQRKMHRKTEKKNTVQENRRAEMMARHDEIRQKYGLRKGSNYTRFENA